MLFEAHIQLKNMPMAEATAVAYLEGLDEHNRAMFEDIRIVASPEESTPLMPCQSKNARLISEHSGSAAIPHQQPLKTNGWSNTSAEIMYARRHFFSSRGPWDRRGEIYIRYGHPAHWEVGRTMCDFEVDPAAVRVKERLLMSLTDDARKELVANIQRIRTSVRQPGEEVGPEPGIFEGTVGLTDFENVDYSPRVTPRGNASPDRPRENYERHAIIPTGDAGIGTDHLRGYPLFP